MTRPTTLLASVAIAVLAMPATAAEPAAETRASELAANPDRWAGRRVIITGELVGDYSPRDDGVWVQLNEDPFVGSPIGAGGVPDATNTGIGAQIPTDVFSQIEGPPGRYGRTGPVVRLEGVFRHSDPAFQGETYLAVDTATTITPSRQHPVPGPDLWLPVGILLLAAAGGVLYTSRRNGVPAPGEDSSSPLT